MAVAKRSTGKYGRAPYGGVTIMTRVVTDRDYKLHGFDTPVYQYTFLQDEKGNNFGFHDGHWIHPEDLDEWERKLIM